MLGIHLLYKILKENKPHILVKLNKKWFLTPEEREYYKKIKAFITRYGVLPKPATEPVDFKDEPLEFYVDQIRNRYLKYVLERVRVSNITEENASIIARKLLKEIRDAELSRVDLAREVVSEEEISNFVMETVMDTRIKRVAGLYGYSTGYPTLDLFTGGFLPGDIFVICARMKKGKTIYLLNMVRKLAKDYPCMFVSMEMSLKAIMRRLIFLETKLPQIITSHRILPSLFDEELKKIQFRLTLINGAVISDVSDIANFIDYYKPQIVFVDGAYLLPTEKKFGAEWERAKYIIEELRRIALATDRPIVCTYQLNRQAVKAKEPRLEFIAFTDAIAQSASVVIAVSDGDTPTERKFYILANREGESDLSIRVSFDWSTANFEEITDIARVVYTEEEVDLEEDYLGSLAYDEAGAT